MADGLLNKASIILTPTGYKAGTLYNVAPVVEPYEDFDFARASVASRVNSSGLVEMVGRTLSSELITDGSFPDGTTAWTFSNPGGTHGWRIADGKAICDTNAATANRNLSSSLSLDSSKDYKLTIDILQSADNITVYVGGTALSPKLPTSEILGYEYYISSSDHSGGVLMFYAGSSDLQEIDNVSVKEIIDTNNIPRISYDSNGDNGHILLEPTSENKVTYSEDFSQWSNTDITFGTDGVSPSGETNANLIQTGTAGNDQVSKAFALSPTNTTTYSVFIKRVGGAEWIDFLIVKSGFLNSLKVWFNINNGTVGGNNANGTTTLDSASIEDYGNDWYRLIVTTTDSTNNTSFNIRVRTASADGSDTRVDNSSYYLWGMQLEALPYATSYIPSLTGSTETRETETATGAGSADLINSTEGVLYAEIAALADDLTGRYITISDGGTNNMIRFYYNTNSNGLTARYYVGNTTQCNFAYTLSNATTFNKIAFKWKVNDFALWVNGTEVATDTSGAVNVADTFNEIDFRIGGGNNFYGKCKALAVFNEALSDAELNNLTG